jgi:hypothetical protein
MRGCQNDAGAQGEAVVSFFAVLARQNQQSAVAESLVDGLGDAFADPVEIRRFIFVEVKERENGPLR